MRSALVLILLLVVPGYGALAADADNGRRLAQARCVPCHLVSRSDAKELSEAPPFEMIGRKFGASPERIAFAVLDPHPRMNLTLTRREAQDLAEYINTLAK